MQFWVGDIDLYIEHPFAIYNLLIEESASKNAANALSEVNEPRIFVYLKNASSGRHRPKLLDSNV